MKLVKIPDFARLIYPSITWKIPTCEKKIFLTFDDGPHPQLTPKVLAILDAFQAKATFFCLGENVERYPACFEAIVKAGHTIGNHGYKHLNGWKTKSDTYVENFLISNELIHSKLIRMPYGKIRLKQIRMLKLKFQLIGWSVMCYDFDASVNSEQCFEIIQRHSKRGSIIVMHENDKATDNMLTTLPRVLKYFSDQGFIFDKL